MRMAKGREREEWPRVGNREAGGRGVVWGQSLLKLQPLAWTAASLPSCLGFVALRLSWKGQPGYLC